MESRRSQPRGAARARREQGFPRSAGPQPGLPSTSTTYHTKACGECREWQGRWSDWNEVRRLVAAHDADMPARAGAVPGRGGVQPVRRRCPMIAVLPDRGHPGRHVHHRGHDMDPDGEVRSELHLRMVCLLPLFHLPRPEPRAGRQPARRVRGLHSALARVPADLPAEPKGSIMTYRDRREARAERLRGWAGKREQSAAAVFKAGEPFTSDIAFNTQPGHIPFRARLIAREDRAYESLGKAASMRSRADGIEGQLADVDLRRRPRRDRAAARPDHPAGGGARRRPRPPTPPTARSTRPS